MAKQIMTFAENDDRDLLPVNDAGLIPMCYDLDSIKIQIQEKLLNMPNESDIDPGVDLALLFSNSQPELKATTLIAAIRRVPLVKDVLMTNFAFDKPHGVLTFQFYISTILGDLLAIMGIDEQNKTMTFGGINNVG